MVIKLGAHAVAEPLGLPAWPVLPIPLGPPNPHSAVGYKARAIARYLTDNPRAFAWCNDFIHRPDRLPEELRAISLPHLLVSPNSRIGLTAQHIETLLAFARTSNHV